MWAAARQPGMRGVSRLIGTRVSCQMASALLRVRLVNNTLTQIGSP